MYFVCLSAIGRIFASSIMIMTMSSVVATNRYVVLLRETLTLMMKH